MITPDWIAVGGVEPEDFGLWLQAGVNGSGLGTVLYRAGDSPEAVVNAAQRAVLAYDAGLP